MIKIFEVFELNKYINALLQQDVFLSDIKVIGEISNFTHHKPSGHMYFSLKDEESRVKCVMFKRNADEVDFEPKDGDKVTISGYVSMYERDGAVQLYAEEMEQSGFGDLFKKFEELKEKLLKEGLFDEVHKKEIAKFPKSIGIVTSKTGAAIKDITNVLKRRFPICDFYIYPTLVQGESASKEIVKGLQTLDEMGLDTIILARGGGSYEDLFCFNDETLARTIFGMETPVITGIGHEIDFTIADYVADLRAPTPSAAAELATPDLEFLVEDLDLKFGKVLSFIDAKIEGETNSLNSLKRHLKILSPTRKLDEMYQRLDHNFEKLLRNTRLTDEFNKLEILKYKLEFLNPVRAMERGFNLLEDDSGSIVSSIKSIDESERYRLYFKDGNVQFKFNIIEKKADENGK